MRSLFRAVLIGSTIAVVNLPVANAEDSLPIWFKRFVNEINSKLAQQSAQITQNSEDIARLTTEVIALKQGITTYDYRDYAGKDVTSLTYNTQGSGICGTTETLTNVRQLLADGSTQLLQTRERVNASSAICQYDIFDFRATATGFSLLSREGRSPTDTNLTVNTNVLDDPLLIRTAAMRVGASWGSAASSTQTAFPSGTVNFGTAMQVTTLLAVESVTVPAGTFNDCIKLAERRDSAHIGNFLAQTSWYCRGIGLTKRVSASNGGASPFVQELTAYSLN